MSDKCDLSVLGGGPGGYVAAIRAAQLGAKVALIEKEKVGGNCLNRGCIPTKALIACTNLFERMKRADKYGIKLDNIKIDLGQVIERKNLIISKAVKNLESLIIKNNIGIFYGTGKVLEPGKVEVEASGGEKRLIESGKLILATGSSPASLPGISFDGDKFLSSNDLLENRVPIEKLDIVGGGVIGIHFAEIYSAFGCSVTVFEALPEILPGTDEEIIARFKRTLKKKGVEVVTNAHFEPSLSSGKTLLCVGRTPNLAGLESLGLKMEGKSVLVNEKMETSIPGIYAVGDLASRKMLAHVAFEQGMIAAENALGADRSFDYGCVPVSIYTDPEIGCVGLTEKEAKEKHEKIKVGKFLFAALGIAQAVGETEGMVKVIADGKNNILGVHILGPEATTLIGCAAIAIKNRMKVDQLAGTFQAHPTFSEGLQEAALNSIKRSLHILN